MSDSGVTTGRSPLPEVSYVFDGDDGLSWTVLFVRLREAMSEPFEAELILAGDDDASPDALLGGSAVLQVHRGVLTRSLRGVVRFVEDLGSTATQRIARIGVVPRLWLLSQRTNSRIFQDKHAVEIVTEVLRDAGIYQDPGALEKGAFTRLPKREYCVQYRESDLDFVQRLLQDEGVPYYFKHERDGGEALVLVDDPAYYAAVPTMDGGATRVSDASMNVDAAETLSWFDLRKELRPTSTTLREYDFTHPRATREMTTASPPGEAGPRAQYDYPARTTLHRYSDERGVYTAHDGAAQARMRQEAQQAPAVQGRGRGNVSGVVPGTILSVAGHHRGEADAAYLVTRVEHRGQAWSDIPTEVRRSERLMGLLADVGMQEHPGPAQRYSNRFEVVPASVPWRPARRTPRPIVQGAQTARVVGPAGEEIHTDPHGRIKVQFHWDREGTEDEWSSCWVRVQQNWAGSGWGFQFIPRIGMEVVVSFLEGDPDRPLVTGCVYNGENRSPHALPMAKTRSSIKTSSSPHGHGSNELTFEDLNGQEEVYLHAQRNYAIVVNNDQSIRVDHNRRKHISFRESNFVGSDRASETSGDETKTVHGNLEVSVAGPLGMRMHVDQAIKCISGQTIRFECGDSALVLTPAGITLRSSVIRLQATNELILDGEPILLNCETSPR